MSNLFGEDRWWESIWRGMPEFVSRDLNPAHSVAVNFQSEDAVQRFAGLLGKRITENTKWVWFPDGKLEDIEGMEYGADEEINPRHPVYVISKGRSDTRLTGKALDRMGVPYWMVVEPQERDQYAAVMDPSKILALPFSNLGQGSIPARNWCWEHSIAAGAERHFIVDDNIGCFLRLNRNRKVRVETGAIFRAAEQFVDRYENVALAGFNYRFLGGDTRDAVPPLRLNRRIYSCILIKNDLPYRWRGRYNEDTDLSLRALKDGWCTVLFQAFLIDKKATMSMGGGNTDELYRDDGRLKMAESLVEQHPDVARVTWKWGRFQHHVDYSGFRRNELRLRPGAVVPDGPDEMGMVLRRRA